MRDAQPRVVVAALGVLATAFCSMAAPSAGECAKALASTLTVGDSCTYADLQAAVDAAVSGDTILVQGKTFTGPDATTMIDDKSLTIVGGYDATCSSLDGSRSILDITAMGASAFWINGRGGSSIVIDRFDITGGDIYSANGCGIYTFNQGNVTLIDVDIYGNNANFGGGVSVEDGSLHLKAGSRISGNSASGGGGVFCLNGTVTIEDSEIGSGDLGGNSASHHGGGIHLVLCTLEVGTTTGTGRIQFNSAAWDGGGIYADSSDIFFNGANATVNDNTSTSNGGGLYLHNGSTFTATGGGVENNVAGSEGGGFFVIDNGSAVTMSGAGCPVKRCARISNNQSDTGTSGGYGQGGGVYVTFNSDATISLESVFLDHNSSGSEAGSAICSQSGTVRIDSSMITDNSCGAFTIYSLGVAEIRSSTIANNSSVGGELIFVGSGGTTAEGLIVWGNDATALASGTGTITIDHSVEQYGVGGTNIVADPLFIDPAGGNFHIQPGSPAVDLSPSGSAVDIDCEPRPLGAAWDAGADEEWASTINIFIDGFETGNTNAWTTTVGGV